MNLQQIKNQFGLDRLRLNTAEDAGGNKTEWMRHWDNDNRIAISLHKDLVAHLKANPEENDLDLQTSQRQGEQGDYTSVRIIKYKEAEELL